MGTRLLDAGVALAALVSAVLLGAMLAAPVLPQAGNGETSFASPSAEPSASVSPELPPLGLFLLRGPYAFGPCLALELTPPSYPIGENAGPGVARVLWWERGMTGCDTRTGEVTDVEASVERIGRENAPDETAGYLVAFELPASAGVATEVHLTILAERSTQELLQVTDSGAGQGLVFDRVEVVDPPLDPLPTPPPPAALQPIGAYLLAGTFGPDGPCLVLDLDQAAYSPDPNVPGTAGIRWWEPAVSDPEDPARCLMRRGDVHSGEATVMTLVGDAGTVGGYRIVLAIPVPATGSPQEAAIGILLDGSTREHLEAVAEGPLDGAALGFDRVDSIDPPLGP